ncbi:MAG: hypothetical protein AAB263_18140, partial [Planctomycetota bacterium]
LASFASCEEGATKLALDKIPASVTAAAVAALPGFTAASATSEVEDGNTSYDLLGKVAGKEATVEVEVDAKGKITIEATDVEVAVDQ